MMQSLTNQISLFFCTLVLCLNGWHAGENSLVYGQSNTSYVSFDLPDNNSFYSVRLYTERIAELNKIIEIQAENSLRKDILEEIAAKAKLGIAYNAELNELHQQVSFYHAAITVGDALTLALEGTGYEPAISKTREIVLAKIDESAITPVDDIQETITGKVTDESGEPLPGVNIIIEGTTTGISTDLDGNYELTVPSLNETLSLSYIGYRSQTIPIDGRTEINVTMEMALFDTDELVVIGYGVQRRSSITSAVSSIGEGEFVTSAARDAGQLLQGKSAGLIINTPSGNPAAGSQILLRGIATLASSTQPLILIDGIPGNLNTVAPEDIESINVLKDGSAAAIYGTRGTNGVILIATKKVDRSNIAPSLTYNGSVSTQSFVNPPNMLSAEEYRYRREQGTTGFQDLGHDTDWMREVSRTPITHVHSLALSGGNAETSYIASLNYRNFEGIFEETMRERVNGRIDVDHRMFENKLNLNVQFLTNYDQYNSLGPGTSFDNTIYKNAFTRNPTAPLRNEDGSWHEQSAISYYENPKALIHESNGLNESQSTRISGHATWFPIDELLIKGLVSHQRNNTNYGYSETKNHISTTRDQANGRAFKSSNESINQLLELTAEYAKALESHDIALLGGYSYQYNESENLSMNTFGFPAGSFVYQHEMESGSALGDGTASMSSGKNTSNLIGFFGRLSYSYQDKYLLMASLRHEAASQFLGTNKPWGTFPAISAGWVISEEPFMDDVAFFDELKIRTGYGITGTAPNASFLAVSRLGYSGYSLIDGNWIPNLVPVSNPNPHLRWEEKKEANLGIDFSAMGGRASGSLDYYNRTTDGLLYDYPVPSPPNLYNTTTANVGIMKNKGYEAQLNLIPVVNRSLNWTTTFNFSTNENELVSLSNDLYQRSNEYINVGSTGSPVQTYTHRVEVGKEIGNYYGYKVTDITEDGLWIYEDMDGNSTMSPVEADKKVLGNGLPNYYAGWNNSFYYKNFDLNITMRGAFDFEILNFTRMYYELPGFELYNQLESAYDEIYGKAALSRSVSPTYNSHYVEKGDYWKIDNITLGYSFNLANINQVQTARVYVSTLNTYTFTGYKGSDPEVSSTGLSPGNDSRDKYPSTRVFNLGVQLSF